jgi:hypothetical protein
MSIYSPKEPHHKRTPLSRRAIDRMMDPTTAVPVRANHQRLTPTQGDRLIRDFIRARDSYLRACREADDAADLARAFTITPGPLKRPE